MMRTVSRLGAADLAQLASSTARVSRRSLRQRARPLTVATATAPRPPAPEEEKATQAAEPSAPPRALKPMPMLVSTTAAKQKAALDKPPATGLADIMGFAGSAPERVNGRLAMLGFAAALGAELRGGGTVAAQLDSAPTAILLAGALVAIGSLVPLAKGSKGTVVFPFTADVEMWNGRFAMLGLLTMLVIEAVSGVKAF